MDIVEVQAGELDAAEVDVTQSADNVFIYLLTLFNVDSRIKIQ